MVGILLGDPAAAATFLGGVGVMLGIVFAAWRRTRRIEARAHALLSMAVQGRPDEARIQARMGGRAFAPFLAALGGELAPPSRRPLLKTTVEIVAVSSVPCALVGNGLRVLHSGETAGKVAASVTVLIGVAALAPLAVVSSVLLTALGRSGARAVRAAAISVLARTVRPSIDAELASALRRHRNRKEARG